MKLSITIPSLPSRTDKLVKLCSKLEKQIPQGNKDVEILSIVDNKTMSIGRKRQALFQLARGQYICQIDDDDDVEDTFIPKVLDTINQTKGEPEVINYYQRCDIDGDILIVIPSIEYPTNDSLQGIENKTKQKVMLRYPWHWCCWRSDIAKAGFFYDCNSQEDNLFPRTLQSIVKKEYTIPEVLVHYIWRTTGTEAPFIHFDLSKLPVANLKVIENK